MEKGKWNQGKEDRSQAVREQEGNAEGFKIAQAAGMAIEGDGDAAETGHSRAKLGNCSEDIRAIHDAREFTVRSWQLSIMPQRV